MDSSASYNAANGRTSLKRRTSSYSSQSKPWQSSQSRPSFRSSKSRTRQLPEEQQRLSRETTRRSTTKSNRRSPKWWKIRLFKGIIDDVKRRAPYYWSDWTDAWDYRVVPATVYMYFANILPALAFSLDMFVKTNNSYGVNEVLLSSVLGCVVFALLAAQPLVIVGVTGPITVFSYTVYDIVTPQGINFFSFMCWIGIWSLIMHWVLAATNSCNALTYVTRFSCDTFGFYVAMIYLQKGIQVLTRQWTQADAASAYLQIIVALLVLGFAYSCGIIGRSKLFHRHVRKFIEDYGTPLTVVFFTGFVYYGHMRDIGVSTLPTRKAFFPTADRSWFVSPRESSAGDVFLAIPFAALLTILFYFDHNVSSLIAQGTEFPLRKPPGFHWDIFLLGLTTFVAGILGIPFPNGLIPQAPFHTASLCATRLVSKSSPGDKDHPEAPTHFERVVDHVVEQRVSNLAQGLLFLVTMTGPLLIVLHLIPQGVLAGLFFVMGSQALAGNGITQKMLFLARDPELTDITDPLTRLDRKSAIYAFVALELVGFAATFAITQTTAAIGFPVIIIALIPFRSFAMPRWFRPEELRVLDAPTAGAFVMESVGGAYGADDDDGASAHGTRSPPPGLHTPGEDSAIDDGGGEAVDDSLERGESYELRSGAILRTRVGSYSTHERPADLRRRSLSTRGRGEVRS